jgi:hypothetical protein
MDRKDFRKLECITVNRALFTAQGSRLSAEEWRILAYLNWAIKNNNDFKDGWAYSEFNEDVLCKQIGCKNYIFKTAWEGLEKSGWIYPTGQKQPQPEGGMANLFSLRLPSISKR